MGKWYRERERDWVVNDVIRLNTMPPKRMLYTWAIRTVFMRRDTLCTFQHFLSSSLFTLFNLGIDFTSISRRNFLSLSLPLFSFFSLMFIFYLFSITTYYSFCHTTLLTLSTLRIIFVPSRFVMFPSQKYHSLHFTWSVGIYHESTVILCATNLQ